MLLKSLEGFLTSFSLISSQTMNSICQLTELYTFFAYFGKKEKIWNKFQQKISMNFLSNNYLFCYLTGSKWIIECAPFICMIDSFQFIAVENRMQLWKQISVSCICIPWISWTLWNVSECAHFFLFWLVYLLYCSWVAFWWFGTIYSLAFVAHPLIFAGHCRFANSVFTWNL